VPPCLGGGALAMRRELGGVEEEHVSVGLLMKMCFCGSKHWFFWVSSCRGLSRPMTHTNQDGWSGSSAGSTQSSPPAS
jgi:hypothetical protein